MLHRDVDVDSVNLLVLYVKDTHTLVYAYLCSELIFLQHLVNIVNKCTGLFTEQFEPFNSVGLE